jgi:hypothetical protein
VVEVLAAVNLEEVPFMAVVPVLVPIQQNDRGEIMVAVLLVMIGGNGRTYREFMSYRTTQGNTQHPNIKPGLGVEFIYYSDYIRDNIHVMRAVLYDVMNKKLILSQSLPNVMKSSLKQDILVTYLEKKDQGHARYGFSAIITELIDHYKTVLGNHVPAIVIEQKSFPKPIDIRLYYHLKVPFVSDLAIFVDGEAAILMDISIGGAKIGIVTSDSLKQHNRIRLTVRVVDRSFVLDAEVTRVWTHASTTGNEDLQIVSIRFLNAGRKFDHFLGKKIFTIERELLAAGRLPS